MNIAKFFILLLLALPATAWGDDFSAPVAQAQLSAAVSHASLNFQPAEGAAIGGNRVENVSVGNFGIVAIAQNNGAQSNVLQAVTVSIGRVNLRGDIAPN